MLDFIYYPVSFILWVWHKVFGFLVGDDNAFAWILGIVFLTFTIRGIMFKPFVNQVRSMRKMQDFAPEIKKIQKKYANDRQRQAQEMQRLQREHGVNPLGSCLPMLLQIPVFIGLNRVLRNFQPGSDSNYFFDEAGVTSYVNAKIFGVNLGEAINGFAGISGSSTEGWNWDVAPVAVPLMVVASVATHFSARHSASRQSQTSASPQTAMMNKLTMYVFPAGLLVIGAFLPIGLLIYFLSNNVWTLGQQRLIYTRIDKEEEEKKEQVVAKRTNLAPRPGQKPVRKPAAKSGQNVSQQADEQSTESATSQKSSGGAQSKTKAKVQETSSDTTSSSGTAKNGAARKGGSELRGGAWAKHGGNQRGQAAQGKKTQGRKRR